MKSEQVALGIDVGTGSTKVGFVDADGRLLAVGRSPHVISEPQPGWSESDPAGWLMALAAAFDEAVAALGGSPEVAAVGFSGQMHGVVLCDGAYRPVRPAVLWSDQRSQPHLERFRSDEANAAEQREQEAERGEQEAVNPIVAGMAGPTIGALHELEPQTLAVTETMLQPKDWVRLQLTGVAATDASDASATLLWDDRAGTWSAAACTRYHVPSAWLPPVLRSDAPAGVIDQAAADRLGLPAGVPVAVGSADTAAALFGAGLGDGETQVSTGTGGQIARLLPAPVFDPTRRTHLYRGADRPPVPGGRSQAWYAMAAIQNAGIAIEWALGVLDVSMAEVAQAVSASPVGSNGVTFLPYLTGERTPHLDSSLTGCWSGLRPGIRRTDLVRSVFEGVAFALRDGLEALRVAGHSIDRALLAGGGSTTAWWRQLLADALDIPLIPHDAADASVRGAGLLAWASVGASIDPSQVVNRLDPIRPGPDGPALAEALDRYRAAATVERAVVHTGAEPPDAGGRRER